jgi:hypothetical protein
MHACKHYCMRLFVFACKRVQKMEPGTARFAAVPAGQTEKSRCACMYVYLLWESIDPYVMIIKPVYAIMYA